MKLNVTMLLVAMFATLSSFSQSKFTISGYITDAENGESLIGATVYEAASGSGVGSNVYGFYSITLDEGPHVLKYSFIGYNSIEKTIDLSADVTMNIELTNSSIMVDVAVVEAESAAEKNVESVEMSNVDMNMETIKKIPAFMGEVDIIKAIQFLPGVQTVGEGSSGFYVRGGAVDQNLILLDEAPVYNASHFLGFFSVFNSDAIKDVKLYKGGIPARYGGRLSSVLDIRMKEGNKKKFSGSGGLGTISSRLTLESPFAKGKGSVLLSGRRTYADVFLLLSKQEGLRNTKLYFYDFNMKANYEISENDRIYASGYFGKDVTSFNDLFNISWGNTTATVRWNHLYNSKLFSNLTFVYSDFDYALGQNDPDFGFLWESDIQDFSLKLDYSYFPNPNNTIRFGAISTKHRIDPGFARGTGDDAFFGELRVPISNALESAIYVSNEQSITENFTLQYGLRYSIFNNMGAGTQYYYDENYEVEREETYGDWEIYNTYTNLEPRFGMNYRLNKTSSVKASYNRTTQYLHLASNSQSASPLDIWFASSPNVKPQLSDQIALGYFKNLKDNQIEVSAEVYYKEMKNSIDFKNNAELLLNEFLEGELRIGEARSYGLELFLRKREGKFNGMISYTLARTERLIPEIAEDYYPTKYDKTHDVSVLVSYDLNERWTFGSNFVFSTGAATTMPTGRFEYFGTVVPVYSERNGARMPNYHRLDLSATLQGKEKPDRKWKGEWVFSVYNTYFRKNPYSINFRQEEDNPNATFAEMTYLLPIIPAITYNFKF